MSPKDQEKNQAILEEIKVVLIRAMISDQLEYVSIAKDWFSIEALEKILKHKIGYGKIGGKSAGMLLAQAILLAKATAASLTGRCSTSRASQGLLLKPVFLS